MTSENESTSGFATFQGPRSTATTTGWTGSGAFGADVRVHDHVSVFGEAGVQYETQRQRSTLSSGFGGPTPRTELEFTQFGLRSAVGVEIVF